MKGWKSYLLWEGLPFLMILLCFGFVSLINFSYESKLLVPIANAKAWPIAHMGLVLLAAAVADATFASAILFLVRRTCPKVNGEWYMFISLTLVAIFLIFPSLFIVLMGPASITLFEQMSQTPG